MSVPIILYAEEQAKLAFEAHAALLVAEAANPSLSNNPAWTVLRQDAYERFASAYRKVG